MTDFFPMLNAFQMSVNDVDFTETEYVLHGIHFLSYFTTVTFTAIRQYNLHCSLNLLLKSKCYRKAILKQETKSVLSGMFKINISWNWVQLGGLKFTKNLRLRCCNL